MIARCSQFIPERSGRAWTLGLLGLFILAAAGSTAARGDAALPEAGTILDRAVEAVGGADAIRAVQTRVSSGKFLLPAMGIEGALTSWAARPNLIYTVIESPALGQIVSGSDGTNIWENTAMAGPNLKEGEERAVSARQNDMDGLANWRKHYSSVETVGKEEVDGAECYKLSLTPNEGPVETHFYNAETGLLAKMEMTMKTDMGEIPIESFLSDYREVSGLMIPFHTRQIIMKMQEMATVIDSVAINVEIPPDRFALPPAIQALVEKKEAERK